MPLSEHYASISEYLGYAGREVLLEVPDCMSLLNFRIWGGGDGGTLACQIKNSKRLTCVPISATGRLRLCFGMGGTAAILLKSCGSLVRTNSVVLYLCSEGIDCRVVDENLLTGDAGGN